MTLGNLTDGRGKHVARLSGPASASKSRQIRALLGSGMSAPEIAATVRCSTNLVYVVKSNEKSRRNGRSPVVAPPPPAPKPEPPLPLTAARTSLDAVLSALRQLERERDMLRKVVEQINALVSEL